MGLRRLAPWIAALALAAGPAAAQPAADGAGVLVLATNAITDPLTAIAAEQRRGTGRGVELEFATSPSIGRRLMNGATAGVGVVIAATATIDTAVALGLADPGTRTRVGRVGIGIVIPRGRARPDISSVDVFAAALREADAVVFSRGASGVYAAQLLETLGLAEPLRGRAVQLATGADMLERIAMRRANEIGMTQISEIVAAAAPDAIVYVGPLPAPVQHYTSFDAVALTHASEAARELLRELSSQRARELLAANHWEP